MVTTKRCAWGKCSNDSRLPHLLNKNANRDEVFSFIFLGLNIMARNGDGGYKHATKAMGLCAPSIELHICSPHFVGENGPTADYPDPTSAVKSAEHVSFHEQLKC